jgi:hypothetical protein
MMAAKTIEQLMLDKDLGMLAHVLVDLAHELLACLLVDKHILPQET